MVGCRQLRRRAPVLPVEPVVARLVLWPALRLKAEARLVRARLWVAEPSMAQVALEEGPLLHQFLRQHLSVGGSVVAQLALWPVRHRLVAVALPLLPHRRSRATRRARCTATTAPMEGTAQGSRTTVHPPRPMTPTLRCSPCRVGPMSLSERKRLSLRTTRTIGRRCET